MDTHRGDRHGNSPDSHDYRHPRGPSRFSDSPMNNHHRRIPNSYRGGGPGGGGRDCSPFDSPPRYPPSDIGGFRPMGGGGGAHGAGGFSTDHHMPPLSGHKRGHPFSGGGASPVRFNGGSFAKLFVGSVPRTATEDVIRPLFEEYGRVLEVALIKDRKTGQQQGCCFIKYATSDEADRAIRALHNQHTLPGGVGPIQVRYADGERERLGAAEYKLFVGSLNKQATEKEVEEIFSPYGRVEDVYLMRDDMKQSRGCGFVKFSQRETALTAINALNGIYIMRGCDQPLIVRFADPKKPRLDESRGGPALGGHGFGPRFQAPWIRPPPNLGEPMCNSVPPNAWHPMTSQDLGPASNAGIQSFGNQLLPRSGEMGGPLGGFSGSSDSLSRFAVSSALVPQQNFNPSLLQAPPMGQQISPLQKPLQSPREMPSSLQLQSLAHASFSQTQTSHASIRQPSQPPLLLSAGQTPSSQALPSQQLLGLGGQSSVSRPQVQQNALSATAQSPLNNNAQPHFLSPMANQQQLPGQQQLLQPLHQSPSQLAQMLSHQTQTLQASFQSSQQAFSQLQQQLQLMQPSSQGLTAQQGSQASKQQSPWVGVSQSVVSTSAIPSTDVPSAGSDALAVPVMNQSLFPMKCNWTEHTSPDGFKYYHNITTGESRWEKPHEMTLYEQQQQQKQSIQQRQSHPLPQCLSAQHFHHTQVQIQSQLQTQLQTQLRHSQQLQQIPQSSSVSGVAGHQNIQEVGLTQLPIATSSVNDHSLLQQGLQADQEWMWKNNPAGT